MKIKLRESDIEAYGKRRVEGMGGEIRKVKYIGRNGCPDRHVYFPKGIMIHVEFKAPGEEPEPHQKREHDRLRAMGQRVEVIDSLQDVDNLMAEYEAS